MLRQRVITALLLLPFVLAVILLAPPMLFAGVIALALAVLAREYARLATASNGIQVLFIVLVIAGFAAVVMPWPYAAGLRRTFILAAVLLWLATPLWLRFRHVFAPFAKLFFGFFIIVGAGAALFALKLVALDGRWVLAAFVLVWAADVGGYLFGRLFGRHKLAPNVSPGKTWEGFAGGLLLVIAVGLAAHPWLAEATRWWWWVAILVACGVISVIGDLVESLLKRQAGVKDSGQLLPGHGGMFDRLDSLLAVAPVFFAAAAQLGIFGELSAVWPTFGQLG